MSFLVDVYDNPVGPVGVKTKGKTGTVKEPGIIIKPIGRLGGLDGLHITFAIVIVLLFALLLVVSYSKPVQFTNSTTTVPANCTYGYFNGSCAVPLHSSAEVKMEVERVLASYATVNGSLSILPYFSNVSSATAAYLPQPEEWYVSVQSTNPASDTNFLVSFLVSDSNLSKITPSIQMAMPSSISENYVTSPGTVRLADKYRCGSQSPMSAYWFIDPYAQGSVRSLANATALEGRLGGRMNLTVKIVNGPSTQAMAGEVGTSNALMLGRYVFCASQQPGFRNFTSDLNALYSGTYVPQSTLSDLAKVSKLNYSALSPCLNTSAQVINNQALLASYYNVTQTPSVIVDCEYQALPQTAAGALCYANSMLC